MTLSIDSAEAARIFGFKDGAENGAAAQNLAARIDAAKPKALAVCRPRFVYREFSVAVTPEGVTLDCGLILPGKAAAKLLSNCAAAVCFAATIGFEADSLISMEQKIDISEAVVLDACASAAMENLCEYINAEIRAEYETKGYKTTRRYSPGYGDLPLSVQTGFLKALDAGRSTGITVNSGLMSPNKSVTAIIGVTDKDTIDTFSACAFCPRLDGCNGICAIGG